MATPPNDIIIGGPANLPKKISWSLPQDNIRNTYRAEGFGKAVTSWPFRRYIQEKNDHFGGPIGMGEFMRQHLSEDDYAFYIETSKP